MNIVTYGLRAVERTGGSLGSELSAQYPVDDPGFRGSVARKYLGTVWRMLR